MAIKLSTKTGGGGVLTFPYEIGRSSNIAMKENIAVSTLISAAGFKTAWDIDRSELLIKTASLVASADTTEQTVIDVSGSGILTHVIHPELSASGTQTIRMTIDGEVLTIVSPTLASSGLRLCAGDIKATGYGTSSGSGSGVGSYQDLGYYGTSPYMNTLFVSTSQQAVAVNRVGIKFESSLKVTIQGSVNIHATAANATAYVAYYNTIPKGY